MYLLVSLPHLSQVVVVLAKNGQIAKNLESALHAWNNPLESCVLALAAQLVADTLPIPQNRMFACGIRSLPISWHQARKVYVQQLEYSFVLPYCSSQSTFVSRLRLLSPDASSSILELSRKSRQLPVGSPIASNSEADEGMSTTTLRLLHQ